MEEILEFAKTINNVNTENVGEMVDVILAAIS